MPHYFNNRMAAPVKDPSLSLLDALLKHRNLPVSLNQPNPLLTQPPCGFISQPSAPTTTSSMTSHMMNQLQQRYVTLAAALIAQQNSVTYPGLPQISTPVFQDLSKANIQQNPLYLMSQGMPSAEVRDSSTFMHNFSAPHHLSMNVEASSRRNQDLGERCQAQHITLSTHSDADFVSRQLGPRPEECHVSKPDSQPPAKKRKFEGTSSTGSTSSASSDDADYDEESSGADEDRRSGNTGKRSATVRWTRGEHEQFLEGLERFGVGQWCSIARHCVPSRSPAQVASHHQKFAIRSNLPQERRHKASLLDLTTPKVQSLIAQRANDA
jgi:SHAQKYF class myb-like DNA-binding protein